MNLKEIRTKVYNFLGETEGNSLISLAQCNSYINHYLKRLCKKRAWKDLEILKKVSVVTTTVLSSSTGTTLNVTSAANMGKKRYLVVTDETNYETVQISSITGTVVTLVSPGLTNTYAAGSYVTIENNFFPADIGVWMNIREFDTPNHLQIVRTLRMDYEIPQIKSSGVPTIVYPGGICVDKESATVYTADATTTTTVIVDSGLTAGSDDYYKDWMVIVTTTAAEGYARVTGYTASTKTLNLDRAITGLTTGSTYLLYPKLKQFYLYPIPKAAITLHIRYIRIDELLNDYDIPIFPDEYHMVIAFGALKDISLADRNNKRAVSSYAQFEREHLILENEMIDDNSLVASSAFESTQSADDEESDNI